MNTAYTRAWRSGLVQPRNKLIKQHHKLHEFIDFLSEGQKKIQEDMAHQLNSTNRVEEEGLQLFTNWE